MKLQPKDYSLLEAFGAGLPANHTIMGFEPSGCRFVPKPDPLWRWDRAVLRDLIVWWQEGGTDAAYLFGPTGAGKSSALRNFCAALKIPMYEKTMHQAVEFEELVKVVDLSAGSTIPSYSYLPLAMGAEGYPGVFVANEIDRADPGTVIALNEVLEGQPLLVHLGGLEPVEPQAPYFRIAGTGNSALAGDTVGSYVSVKQQDMAASDRYWILKILYPEQLVEEEILEAAVPQLPKPLRGKMIEVANDIRAAFMGESTSVAALPLTMSTRVLKRWARMTYAFRGAKDASLNPVTYALDRALLLRADGMPEVRRAVLELVKGRFGDAFGGVT